MQKPWNTGNLRNIRRWRSWQQVPAVGARQAQRLFGVPEDLRPRLAFGEGGGNPLFLDVDVA